MITRICKICNKELSIEEFYKHGAGRYHACKICFTTYIQIKRIEKIERLNGKPIKKCLNCGKILYKQEYDRCPKCDIIFRIENNIHVGKYTLRKYLIKTCGHQCEECKNIIWNNKSIPLDIHHIDGDKKNNHLNNLKLLCKNCHAQTDNYCFKNSSINKRKHLNTINNI